MADDPSSEFTPVGGSAPAPAQITPEDYFNQVKAIYPNAKFNGGGRTYARNLQVGGAPHSMHLTDQALDFDVPGVDHNEVFSQLRASGLPVTEALSEGRVGNQGAHLHVGWAPKGNVAAASSPSGFTTASGPPPGFTPVNSGPPAGFTSVAPAAPQAQPNRPQPNMLERGIMGVANSAPVKGLTGAYQEAVTNGLFMEPVRASMEGLGVGMDKLKAARPGMSDEWYRSTLHDLYNQSVVSARDNAHQQTADNPYPGHQIGNFLAGVAGSPEYLLMGGAGKGATVAARIASAAAKNAGIAALSDAAAQGMDMIAGVKKDFDITQNLTQAATGGVIGGALHGVSEAGPVISDHVKSLFGNRGMDTLPQADPRGSKISPLSQDHIPTNQADAAQYHELLRTGSVDDIKDFFKGRNGPQPSWTDVSNWVNHRELHWNNVTDTHLQPEYNFEQQQHRSNVEEHINQQTEGWKNAPQFEVVHGPEDIADPAVKAQAHAEDSEGNALGFLGSDGKVRIFSGRITSPEQASAVTFHEGLGHFGLAEKFGDKLDATLSTLVERNVGQFGKRVSEWQEKNPGAYGGDRIRAAEEVLAEDSQNGRIKSSWQDALSASVRQFGRKMGLKLSYSDSEVKQILAMAHDAVVNGKGSDVTANGFKGSVKSEGPNKFMFTGPKARTFDPNDRTAFTASDDVRRNEISDKGAKLTGMPMGTLGGVLDHPALYDQYPELRHTKIVHDPRLLEDHGFLGAFDHDTNAIHLDASGRDFDPLSTVLHETQHAIQNIEHYPDFEKANEAGGTHKSEEYAYDDHPSELEARATEARRTRTTAERAEKPVTFMRASQFKEKNLTRDDEYTGALEETAAAHANYESEPVSFEETKRAALNLGFKPSQIKDLGDLDELNVKIARIGGALNAAKDRITTLNAKLDGPDWTMGDKAQYVKTVADYNYLMDKYLGHGTEMGRGLNTIKQLGFTRDVLGNINDLLRENGDNLTGLADDETFLKFARAVKEQMEQGNDAGLRVTMRAVTKPYWEQYLTTLWHNSMLSSLATHFKSSLDMINGIGLDAQERILAMPIGAVRQLFGGEAGRTPMEAGAYSYGALRAVGNLEMYKAAGTAFKTGQGSFVEPNGNRTLTNTNSFGTIQNPRIPGKVMGLLNKPIDTISAQDTIFRSVSMAGHLYDRATQMATTELGKGASMDDVRLLADSYAHNPTESMITEARHAADKTLLMNANPLNTLVDKGRVYTPNMTINQRVGAFLLNTLTPFIRVESNNLWSRFVMRSPLGFIDRTTRQQLRLGGKDADIAIARMAYGTIKMALFWNAASTAKDLLTTHGPDAPDKRKQLQAQGWSPDAVHENGHYNESSGLNTSFLPWDLHNNTASMVASMREAYEKGSSRGQVAIGLKLALGSILHDIASQSWVHDLGPIVESSVESGDTAAERATQVATNEATNFFPNGLTQIAHLMDPNKHDTTAKDALGGPDMLGTIANTLKSRTPGLTNDVPIRYSVYGDPLPNGASLTGVPIPLTGGQPLIRGNGTNEVTDPVKLELKRLDDLMTKQAQKTGGPMTSLITPVQHSVKTDDMDEPRKLTPAEFENYQHLAGINIVAQVREAMADPSWKQMDDNDKAQTVRDIQTDVKKDVRDALYGQQ